MMPTATSGSPANDNEFSQYWDDAVKAFCDATGEDINKLLLPLSKEQIDRDIEETRARDKRNVDSAALANVMKGLSNVTGIVVDVASDVGTSSIVLAPDESVDVFI